jgi:hypothetical protein
MPEHFESVPSVLERGLHVVKGRKLAGECHQLPFYIFEKMQRILDSWISPQQLGHRGLGWRSILKPFDLTPRQQRADAYVELTFAIQLISMTIFYLVIVSPDRWKRSCNVLLQARCPEKYKKIRACSSHETLTVG